MIKMKIKLAFVSFLMTFLFSCSNSPDKKDNSLTQLEAKENVGNLQKDTGAENTSIATGEKSSPSTIELLLGKWQHIDDKTNYLLFEGNLRKEIAGGMDKWDEETFILSDKCSNETDKDNGTGPEKDRYISCTASDMCWYIAGIDKENLTLSYIGRGNTLTYKRVK